MELYMNITAIVLGVVAVYLLFAIVRHMVYHHIVMRRCRVCGERAYNHAHGKLCKKVKASARR